MKLLYEKGIVKILKHSLGEDVPRWREKRDDLSGRFVERHPVPSRTYVHISRHILRVHIPVRFQTREDTKGVDDGGLHWGLRCQ